ncbi:MAG: hypothetical protein ACI9EW_002427 [Cellvibrionaceae bacterium]|jgi:hypothetical protein
MSKTIEILKFLWVNPDKKRLIQVRGQVYSSVDDISDERVQRVVRQSVADMVQMAGGYEKLIADGFLKASKAQAPESFFKETEAKDEMGAPPPIESKNINLELTQTNAEKPLPPPLNIDQKRQGDVDRESMLNRFRNLTNRKPEEPQSALPTLDIAGQINQVLQERIELDRSFIGRQLELRSTLQGDLLFIVDGRSYESVNDISDEVAASLFRDAIAEWEIR